jgi:hypothetical protein
MIQWTDVAWLRSSPHRRVFTVGVPAGAALHRFELAGISGSLDLSVNCTESPDRVIDPLRLVNQAH